MRQYQVNSNQPMWPGSIKQAQFETQFSGGCGEFERSGSQQAQGTIGIGNPTRKQVSSTTSISFNHVIWDVTSSYQFPLLFFFSASAMGPWYLLIHAGGPICKYVTWICHFDLKKSVVSKKLHGVFDLACQAQTYANSQEIIQYLMDLHNT